MADNPITLAKAAKINDVSIADLGISDLFDESPWIAGLPVVEATGGTVHKYLVQDAAPVVGFRAVNAGRDTSSSNDRQVTADLQILDCSFWIDKALADADPKGPDHFNEREAVRAIREGFAKYESQLLRGIADGDAAGFTGFNDVATGSLGTPFVDGGATANRTSCYFIREGEREVALVLPRGLNISVGETIVQMKTLSNGTSLPVYYTPICTYVGLEVGSKVSVGRIGNLNGAAGATANVLTDTLMSRLLEQFPAGKQPNRIVMHRRSRGAVQRSRTTYSPTGMPAPLPTEYEGIPIMISEGVKIGEVNAA